MNNKGSIPENLLFYSVVSKGARPTFVVDRDNSKTHNTAEKWASNFGYKKSAYDIFEYPNTPRSSVQITSLEHRGEGGRAYKVVVDDRFYLDLREDVLTEAILSCGVRPGGVLNGEYIFASVNSEMKLIRVGSELHSSMIEATKLGKTKSITEFEVGRVYSSKTMRAIYLGKFYSRTIESGNDPNATNCYRSQSIILNVGPNQLYHYFYEISDHLLDEVKCGIYKFTSIYIRRVLKPTAFKIAEDEFINIDFDKLRGSFGVNENNFKVQGWPDQSAMGSTPEEADQFYLYHGLDPKWIK